MAQNNTSLAYDLQRFEQHAEVQQNVRDTITVKREKSVHPVKIVAAAMLVLVMAFTLLYSQVVLTELNSQINSAETRLNTLQAESVRMQTELEGKMSLKEIEEKAISEYGMVKPDGSQVSYVKMEAESRVESAEKAENIHDRAGRREHECSGRLPSFGGIYRRGQRPRPQRAHRRARREGRLFCLRARPRARGRGGRRGRKFRRSR